MYYRKEDSRMGDEIFAMGALLAPFVWKFVKGRQEKLIAKKQKFEALPIEEQNRIHLKRMTKGEMIAKYILIVFGLLEIFATMMGHFSFWDIGSFIPVIAFYIYTKAGKKKYENIIQANHG